MGQAYYLLSALTMVSLFVAACGDNTSSAIPDAGDTEAVDTETVDTDPYAVPEAVIEEPPPYAECEIEWVKTFKLPDPDIPGSIAMGMLQLQNGNYLVVGGAFIPYDGHYGLTMEVTPDGEMVRYALLGQDISYYHHAFETEDGFMLFGQSSDFDTRGCTAMFLSKDFSEIDWEGNIGPEGYDTCFDVERKLDGSFLFTSRVTDGITLRQLDTNYNLTVSQPLDAKGSSHSMTLLGGDKTAVVVNEHEDEYPYYSTPQLLFADGLAFTKLIKYQYSYSAGFDSIAGHGEGHFLVSGGSSYYRASYLLYMTEEGFPLWTKYVGYENGPFVGNLINDGEQYLFSSYTMDWKAYTGRLDENGSILWHYLHQEPGELSVQGALKDKNDNSIIVYGNYLLAEKWAWLMKIKSNENCY